MTTTWQRMQDLIKVQCRIFGTRYNPLNVRTGGKVLRQKLKGDAIAAYYPRKTYSIRDIRRAFPQLEFYQEKQGEREDQLAIIKARGKGAPKKKRSAEESKKNKKGKKPVVPKPA